MRRQLTAFALLGLVGCLEPGDAVLAERDTDPPELESTEPAANGTVARDGTLRITFSESMDDRTLRPGIAVFSGRNEVALRITVPPISDLDQDIERGDSPYAIQVGAASGTFDPNTVYTLVLRTSITDFEGNAMLEEVRVPFRTGP